MQKGVVAAKKFPSKDALKQFCEGSEEIKTSSIECRRGLKRHIKDVVTTQREMFRLAETQIEL